MKPGTYAVASGVQMTVSYVSGTVGQLVAYEKLWGLLLQGGSAAPAASGTDAN